MYRLPKSDRRNGIYLRSACLPKKTSLARSMVKTNLGEGRGPTNDDGCSRTAKRPSFWKQMSGTSCPTKVGFKDKRRGSKQDKEDVGKAERRLPGQRRGSRRCRLSVW